MAKHDMFDPNFSPYDALMELNQRMLMLESAHNRLVGEHRQLQKDMDIALSSIQSLQKGHLAMSNLVSVAALGNVGLK